MLVTSYADTEQAGSATEAIDLPAYLARIGYTGRLEPTADVLHALVRCHMASIPFEAIDVMLGYGVDLDPAAIDRKMLDNRRGGYCFEHASLLRRALHAIGFSLEQHLARVWIFDPLDGPAPPASHASLKVEADGRLWLVDVGFGGFMPNEPLAWKPDEAQHKPYGTFRLTETRDGYMLESWHDNAWAPMYEILDFHWQPVDFEIANHYVATHPQSLFKQQLMIARTHNHARHTLSNNRFKTAFVDGGEQTTDLDAQALARTLEDTFGLPVTPDWQPLIEHLAAGD
ncbi:arylamine N-acetyltransferase [Salinisphaera sp. T5B8]|uniref:arylamine N-acetyltransferase family protein n=1 Tax=Salinisphaera sp. T5B8 TaxID=1304154 RepID=UPI00333F3F3B